MVETERQPSPSATQVETWPGSGQNVPFAVQPAGGVLHWQAAPPAAPVQVCSGPQACGRPGATVTQPCVSASAIRISAGRPSASCGRLHTSTSGVASTISTIPDRSNRSRSAASSP